jgi:hypothetical protein
MHAMSTAAANPKREDSLTRNRDGVPPKRDAVSVKPIEKLA